MKNKTILQEGCKEKNQFHSLTTRLGIMNIVPICTGNQNLKDYTIIFLILTIMIYSK